ncbi:MAG: AraC family ligand binding domain-containing protein, partial [Lachnospiraceae bacterium]|nr:AraC family ligand binding domain-containing protein [Lachnospiraceae bacterium]
MFYSISHNGLNQEEFMKSVSPDLTGNINSAPVNFKMDVPYRLIFNSINLESDAGHFSTCYVFPKGAFYSCMNREETESRREYFKLHHHEFFEFMFVMEGEVYVNIENERHLYKKGSCCILNRNVMHTEEYSTDFKIVFLQISPEFLKMIYEDLCLNFFELISTSAPSDMKKFLKANLTGNTNTSKDYVDFNPLMAETVFDRDVHYYFDSITRETLSPTEASSLRIKNDITDLIRFLSDPGHFSTEPIQIGTDAEYTLFTKITKSMEETYGQIRRSQLAEKLNYSGAYLNEICKKYSGLSLFDYGMTFTMKKAEELLSTTNENISDIESLLGFSN